MLGNKDMGDNSEDRDHGLGKSMVYFDDKSVSTSAYLLSGDEL